jgi:hypothetical protein
VSFATIIAGWALVVTLAVGVVVAFSLVLGFSGVIGQRAASYTGRGWMGAVVGLAIFAALIGGEAWLFRDHIHCGPSGCQEDSANTPEYP